MLHTLRKRVGRLADRLLAVNEGALAGLGEHRAAYFEGLARCLDRDRGAHMRPVLASAARAPDADPKCNTRVQTDRPSSGLTSKACWWAEREECSFKIRGEPWECGI